MNLRSSEVASLSDPADRRIVTLLIGTRNSAYTYYPSHETTSRYNVEDDVRDLLLAQMCGTGRCLQRASDKDAEPPTPLAWDDGPAWQFRVKMTADAGGKHYEATGELARGNECVPLADAWLLVPGIVFWKGRAARLEEVPFSWIKLLRKRVTIRIPRKQGEAFRNEVLAAPAVPQFTLPPELAIEEVRVAPQPRLKVSKAKIERLFVVRAARRRGLVRVWRLRHCRVGAGHRHGARQHARTCATSPPRTPRRGDSPRSASDLAIRIAPTRTWNSPHATCLASSRR